MVGEKIIRAMSGMVGEKIIRTIIGTVNAFFIKSAKDLTSGTLNGATTTTTTTTAVRFHPTEIG
jgi:hypothetical protein